MPIFPCRSFGSFPSFGCCEQVNIGAQVCVCVLLFSSGSIYLGMGLLCCVVILHLACETGTVFSTVAAPLCIPIRNGQGLRVAIAREVGMEWYFPEVFICISLVTNDAEHLFVCSLAIYVSSWRNVYSILCAFSTFIIFKTAFEFTAKLSRKFREFSATLSCSTCMVSPHPSGSFVMIDNPTLTRIITQSPQSSLGFILGIVSSMGFDKC